MSLLWYAEIDIPSSKQPNDQPINDEQGKSTTNQPSQPAQQQPNNNNIHKIKLPQWKEIDCLTQPDIAIKCEESLFVCHVDVLCWSFGFFEAMVHGGFASFGCGCEPDEIPVTTLEEVNSNTFSTLLHVLYAHYNKTVLFRLRREARRKYSQNLNKWRDLAARVVDNGEVKLVVSPPPTNRCGCCSSSDVRVARPRLAKQTTMFPIDHVVKERVVPLCCLSTESGLDVECEGLLEGIAVAELAHYLALNDKPLELDQTEQTNHFLRFSGDLTSSCDTDSLNTSAEEVVMEWCAETINSHIGVHTVDQVWSLVDCYGLCWGASSLLCDNNNNNNNNKNNNVGSVSDNHQSTHTQPTTTTTTTTPISIPSSQQQSTTTAPMDIAQPSPPLSTSPLLSPTTTTTTTTTTTPTTTNLAQQMESIAPQTQSTHYKHLRHHITNACCSFVCCNFIDCSLSPSFYKYPISLLQMVLKDGRIDESLDNMLDALYRWALYSVTTSVQRSSAQQQQQMDLTTPTTTPTTATTTTSAVTTTTPTTTTTTTTGCVIHHPLTQQQQEEINVRVRSLLAQLTPPCVMFNSQNRSRLLHGLGIR